MVQRAFFGWVGATWNATSLQLVVQQAWYEQFYRLINILRMTGCKTVIRYFYPFFHNLMDKKPERLSSLHLRLMIETFLFAGENSKTRCLAFSSGNKLRRWQKTVAWRCTHKLCTINIPWSANSSWRGVVSRTRHPSGDARALLPKVRSLSDRFVISRFNCQNGSSIWRCSQIVVSELQGRLSETHKILKSVTRLLPNSWTLPTSVIFTFFSLILHQDYELRTIKGSEKTRGGKLKGFSSP